MIKNKRFLYSLLFYTVLFALIGFSLKINYLETTIFYLMSLIFIFIKYKKDLKNTWHSTLPEEDSVTWLNSKDNAYNKYKELWSELGIKNLEIGLFNSSEINAYAFEDYYGHNKILISSHMLKHYSSQEFEAVLLHEMGHIKYRHISLRVLISNMGRILVLSFLALFFMKMTKEINIIISLITVFFFAKPFIEIGRFISFFIDQLVSRKCEYEADKTAIRVQGSPIHIMRVLTNLEKGIDNKNLWQKIVKALKNTESDWLQTHPHIDKRLSHAEKFIFLLKK